MRWLVAFAVWFRPADHFPLQREVVSVSVEETVVFSGKDNRVDVWVEVEDGYHIQAHTVSDESLIPTTLGIDSTEHFSTGGQTFPPHKAFRLEGTDLSLEVYDGRFPITVIVRPLPGAPGGKAALRASLRYQACDARTCFFPRVIEFEIPVKVEE